MANKAASVVFYFSYSARSQADEYNNEIHSCPSEAVTTPADIHKFIFSSLQLGPHGIASNIILIFTMEISITHGTLLM